jgi:hypothetical protein
VVSDTVVAGSAGDGAALQAYVTAQVSCTNLTVADVASRGLYLDAEPNASISLYNTIEWNTGEPDFVAGPVTTGNNLTANDPLFVDTAAGNYELGAGSPAIGFGTNSAPGLGTTDLAGGARVIGGSVDAGAYEYGNVFSDGFEYATAARWSATHSCQTAGRLAVMERTTDRTVRISLRRGDKRGHRRAHWRRCRSTTCRRHRSPADRASRRQPDATIA